MTPITMMKIKAHIATLATTERDPTAQCLCNFFRLSCASAGPAKCSVAVHNRKSKQSFGDMRRAEGDNDKW